MANDIFEAASTKTTGAAAAFIFTVLPATLSATVRQPEIREIGIFNQSGVAAQIGIGISGNAGTTPGGSVTVQNAQGGSGNTIVYTTYATPPTTPSQYWRRFDLQAVSGAGVIFTWLPGEWALWSGGTGPLMVYQLSSLAVVYDFYVKVAELWLF